MRRSSVPLLVCTVLAPLALEAQQPARKKGAEPPKSAAAPAATAFGLGAPLLKSLKARSIGPAIMGGRVSEIAVDPSAPHVWYVGFGTGGLWQTRDNGATWSPLFDKEATGSIGAVAVSPANPKLLWVGTGEANDRNSSGFGHGVYKSTDGGATWTNVGLGTSRAIARIIAHPTDTATAYVAATGDLWAPGGERGLYKTTDGGKTWTRILAAPGADAEKTGAGDVVIDPGNPDVLYAALYARERRPWTFTSGANHTGGRDVGGIFKSTDGGKTWTKLGGGLPARTQRIGLAIFPKDPRILYAIVQSDAGGQDDIDDIHSRAGGVFKTTDGGATWTRVNPLNPRPFYFSQIRVDPTNADRVWVLGYSIHGSTDGGVTFTDDRSKGVHADHHALWIDPRNPDRLIVGTDGGVYQSYNGGDGWAHLNRMPLGQFYRINVDDSEPYRICGGLQDNLNWVGPSMTRSKEGILNHDWINIEGGDGFSCFFHNEDRDLVFAESQQGYVHRFDLRTGERKQLRPNGAEGQPAFRFHWNSPLVQSRHQKGVFYLAGNHVFRMTNRGDTWQMISPDLSAQEYAKVRAVGSGAENYGVVYTLAESPKQQGVLWAGTDDGKVWVTENEGANWTDLTANLPAAIRGQWISRIEASWHDPKVAYLAVAAYREKNDAPLAFRTADMGKTWQPIAGNLPANTPVRLVREDPFNPNLLFAGTEFGLYASLDRGVSWTKFGELPTVIVDDILVEPRERDLVIATHGRSVYIVDDIRALQEMTPETAQKPAHLFQPVTATAFYPRPGWVDSEGNAVFRGQNPPEGAVFTYWVKEFTGDEAKLEVRDDRGRKVASLTGPAAPGFNRVTWDLFLTKDLSAEYGAQPKRFVRAGKYTVTLTVGSTKVEQPLEVKVLPGIETR